MTNQHLAEACALTLGYSLIQPADRKNPEAWVKGYWEKNSHLSKREICPLLGRRVD